MSDYVFNEISNPTSEKRSWRKKLLIGLISLVVVGVVALGVKLYSNRLAHERILDDLQSRGEPLTFEKLVAKYHAAINGSDRTNEWLEACTAVGNLARAVKANEIDSDAEDFIKALAPLHRLAAEEAGMRYPLSQDAETGFISRQHSPAADSEPTELAIFAIPPPDDLETAIILLCAEAGVYAAQGDARSGVESLRTGLAVVRTLSEIPSLIGILERVRCHGKVLKKLKEILPSLTPAPADLALLQADLEKDLDIAQDIRWAFRGERVGGLAAFDIARARGDWLFKLIYFDADKTFFLNAVQRLSDQFEMPYLQGSVKLPAVESDMRRHKVSSLLLPLGSASYTRLTLNVAATQVAVQAVALTRYKIEHGGLPETLDELVPDYLSKVPLNPFYETQYQYQLDDDFFWVFSEWNEVRLELDPETGLLSELLYKGPLKDPSNKNAE